MHKENVNTLDPAVTITRLCSVIRFLAHFPTKLLPCRPKTALECADRPASPPVLLSATAITTNSAAACSNSIWRDDQSNGAFAWFPLKLPFATGAHLKHIFLPSGTCTAPIGCIGIGETHNRSPPPPPSANWWNCLNPGSITSGIHSAQSTYLRSSRAWRGWADCFCSQTVAKTLPLSVFQIWRLLALCRRPPLQGDSCGLSIKFT